MAARVDGLARRYGRTPSEILRAPPGDLAVDAICLRAGHDAEQERLKEAGMVFPTYSIGGA